MLTMTSQVSKMAEKRQPPSLIQDKHSETYTQPLALFLCPSDAAQAEVAG